MVVIEGLKVSWKLYAPYTQWKSHLEKPQRNLKAESITVQPAALGPHQQSEFVKPAPLAASEPAPIAEEKPVQPVQPVHQVQVRLDCLIYILRNRVYRGNGVFCKRWILVL